MDNELLRNNIIHFSVIKKAYPTAACQNAGVGKSFLSNIAAGSSPSVAKVAQLAAYLGVTTSQLLGEKEPSDASAEGQDAVATASAETREAMELWRRLTPENRAKAQDHLMYLLDRQGETKDKR